MKIGIISVIQEPWGGSEELWASMASIALQQGHEVLYCTLPFPEQAAKVKVLQQQGLKLVPRQGYVPKQEASWKRQLKKAGLLLHNKWRNPFQAFINAKPDVVIYNGTTFSAIEHPEIFEYWQSTNATKIILSHFLPEHNAVLHPHMRNRLAQFFQQATHCFFVSERSKQNTLKALAVALHNSGIIRNPVNMPDTSALPFPPFQKGVVQLAMVGNLLVMHKGQDTILQTLAQPAWKQLPWQLNIYGKGMDQPYLEQLARMYGIAEKITFHGRVADIRQLWSQNHLLLMPSVMEGMPLAVVEAMLCGRPVLATDVGGHTEWITDNVDGFIAAAASVQCLSDALQRAWQRQHEWARIGQLAHEKAMHLYDPNPGQTILTQLTTIAAAHQAKQ